MINKKLLCSVLSLALLVTGCGSAASSTTAADKNIPADTAAAAEASSGAEESSAAESSAAEQSEAPADEAVADVPGTPEEETAPAAEQAAEEVAPEAALMETLSQWSFIFTSGVGAWQTSLDIGKDGTLTGEFTDQNAGESGEGYDGTLWICQFTGRISNPEQTGPDTWKVSFTDLKYNQPSGTEEIEDRLRYAYTDAYGLETGGALEIYLPGAAVENLPEAYMSWISPLLFSGYFQDSFIDDVPDELPFCGIYNPEGEYGFFSVPKDETRNMKFLVNRGSFPGMKNQTLELNEDGTYLCEDMDEGGLHLVRNLCFRVPENFPSMYSDPEAFCRACAEKLTGGDLDEFYCYTSTKDASSLNNYMYFVDGNTTYYAIWDEGSNEDTRSWTAKMLENDGFVYVYGISLSEYDESMAGEARSFLLSSLSFTGKKDRISMASDSEEGESFTAWLSRDPAAKDSIRCEEAIWVSSGDEEAVKEYGLDPAQMYDDYAIVPSNKAPYTLSFADDAACYVQLPEENAVKRQRSLDELLAYLDAHASEDVPGVFMKVILDKDGKAAFVYEPYRP